MALHADGQGFYAAQGQEAVERPGNRAHRILQKAQLLAPFRLAFFRADDGDAADDVRVAVQVLGGRVHDDVEAVFQRALHQRAGEGIVGHGDDAPCAADVGNRAQVGQFQHRVGGRFDPHHLRFRAQRGQQVFRIGQVDIGELRGRPSGGARARTSGRCRRTYRRRRRCGCPRPAIPARTRWRPGPRRTRRPRCRLPGRPRSARAPSAWDCASGRSPGPCARRGFPARRWRWRKSAA